MTDISPQLREFLTAWLDWAEAGAPEHEAFKPCFSLCVAAEYRAPDPTLSSELDKLLPPEGEYPFGGQDVYDREQGDETMHLNPARLAWVRKMIGRDEQ